MSDDRAFLDRVRQELEQQVEEQSPALQGHLRAARREALEGGTASASHRYWRPALMASLFLVVATMALWFQAIEQPPLDSGELLQTASSADLQILNEGDELELYRDLEFYYWLEQQGAADAG
jgi:hypothetical protein